MLLGPSQDLLDSQISPQERFRSQLQKFLKRRKEMSPNKADGFLSESNGSDAEGSSMTTAPGATQGQN